MNRNRFWKLQTNQSGCTAIDFLIFAALFGFVGFVAGALLGGFLALLLEGIGIKGNDVDNLHFAMSKICGIAGAIFGIYLTFLNKRDSEE